MYLREVWEKRKEFIELCEQANAYCEEFKKLKRARCKKTFEQIICDNLSWCIDNDILQAEIITEGKHSFSGNLFLEIRGGDVKIDRMTGGKVSIYTDCDVRNQVGGICDFWGNASGDSITQSGGNCDFNDNTSGNSVNQSGGKCDFLDNATGNSTNQSGGDCHFLDNATGNSVNQSGGNCDFNDNATGNSVNQTSGYCCFWDNTTGNSVNKLDGECYFNDNATGNSVRR